MSSSLRATGWRPSVADWSSGMSVMLRRGSSCTLSWAMDGGIPYRGTTSSCQSAATSMIVKRCCSRVFSCKQRYIKYPDLYLVGPCGSGRPLPYYNQSTEAATCLSGLRDDVIPDLVRQLHVLVNQPFLRRCFSLRADHQANGFVECMNLQFSHIWNK